MQAIPSPDPSGAQKSATGQASGRRKWRFSTVWLLAALVLLLIVTPLLQDLQRGAPIEAILLTIVLGCAVLAVGVRRRTLVLAILLVVPAILARWAEHYQVAMLPPGSFAIAGAVFIIFVIVHLLGFVLRAPHVDLEVLSAAIAAYLLMGLVWTLAYLAVAQIDPGAFAFTVGTPPEHALSRFEGLYFSLVTLSTVGYGDIVPLSRVARMLAVLEAITGMFYVTILIARLVSLYSSEKPASGADHVTPPDAAHRKAP